MQRTESVEDPEPAALQRHDEILPHSASSSLYSRIAERDATRRAAAPGLADVGAA